MVSGSVFFPQWFQFFYRVVLKDVLLAKRQKDQDLRMTLRYMT